MTLLLLLLNVHLMWDKLYVVFICNISNKSYEILLVVFIIVNEQQECDQYIGNHRKKCQVVEKPHPFEF